MVVQAHCPAHSALLLCLGYVPTAEQPSSRCRLCLVHACLELAFPFKYLAPEAPEVLIVRLWLHVVLLLQCGLRLYR